MKRVPAHELTEDAIPAMVLQTSAQRLRELFPVPFSTMDSLAEAEPSRGVLLRLANGAIVVVTYGTITHRTTISVPVSADARRTVAAIVREAGIARDDIVWLADAKAIRLPSNEPMRDQTHPRGESRTVKPLRERSDRELRAREKDLRDQLFKLRFERTTARLHDPMKARKVRREIARIESLLNERASAKDRA